MDIGICGEILLQAKCAVSITCPAGPLRDTVQTDIYFFIEMVWDSSHYSFCPVPISQQNSSLKGESSFLVVCGVRANFSGDILDKQYLEWIENHYFTYCSIYHNCKTITKTLVHDPCSSMFITHIAVGQILSSARFGIFHCQIVFLLGGRPELLQF